jgi:L-iditol 2-dehydrogenase
MKALVRRDGRVALDDLPSPKLRRDDDVLIRVVLAGICRTDVYVARGAIPVAEPRIIGHEFSGYVLDAGPKGGFRPGERVTVNPTVACGACAGCRHAGACLEPDFIGVQRDGGFAEQIVAPGRNVLGLPDGLSWRRAAYVEPVAAALSVLNAPIDPHERGLVLGDNRITSLVMRILKAHGFAHATRAAVGDLPPSEALFDFIIETEATAESLSAMLQRLRPGGLGVLKSRPASRVPIDVALAVKKGLRLQAVDYGPFARAIELLGDGGLDVDDLLGQSYPLGDFETAFAASETHDVTKLFFAITPAAEAAAATSAARLVQA